jgi:hypothetical protein
MTTRTGFDGKAWANAAGWPHVHASTQPSVPRAAGTTVAIGFIVLSP